MINSKSTALSACLVAVIAWFFQSQPGTSQSNLPQGQSLNSHYSETVFDIGALDTETQQPALQSLVLPVLNRTLRISLTFTATDGELSSGETVACYKSSTGECGFDGGFSRGFNLLKPNDPTTYLAIALEAGPNGTVVVQNYHTAPGSVRIGMWY
jgi:hypothetical protein